MKPTVDTLEEMLEIYKDCTVLDLNIIMLSERIICI